MAIPDYQSFMLPILEYLRDGKQRNVKELYSFLAQKMELSEDDMKERVPSGKQPLFMNRIGWAKTYLKKAGLVDYPARALVIITERGRQVLKERPAQITWEFLLQFDEFKAFASPGQKNNSIERNPEIGNQTPQEVIDKSYHIIRDSLAEELLDRILSQPPDFFEQLVIELLVKMGYGGSIIEAGKAIGKSGDEGIDGTIKEDKLGLDIIYIQAKRWQPTTTVGRPEIQKFVGALAGQGAKKGIFITTSSFSKEAWEYQPKNETKVVLIDGKMLAQHMIDYDIGVSTDARYDIKKIDNDYFGDE